MVHTGRRRGKSRSRILYWFRTPPGVRVGRAALDEDAIRLLEQYNPDVEFDWTRILKGPVEPQPEFPTGRGRVGARREPAKQQQEADTIGRPQLEAPAVSTADAEQAAAHMEMEAETAPEPASSLTPSAALTRLGPEALLRLRARYAEVMARITERVADPVQQEELKTKADRLNPDTWVTDDEVRAGLDVYEATFEALRSVVGRPRKRRRRGRSHARTDERAQPAVTPGDQGDAPKSFEATATPEFSFEDGEDDGDGG